MVELANNKAFSARGVSIAWTANLRVRSGGVTKEAYPDTLSLILIIVTLQVRNQGSFVHCQLRVLCQLHDRF
jgi:hypothetical protein